MEEEGLGGSYGASAVVKRSFERGQTYPENQATAIAEEGQQCHPKSPRVFRGKANV